jgi:hypothetical protein
MKLSPNYENKQGKVQNCLTIDKYSQQFPGLYRPIAALAKKFSPQNLSFKSEIC